MLTRLHLYGKWVKVIEDKILVLEFIERLVKSFVKKALMFIHSMQKCNHAEIYKQISDENLELMRERLMETVIWPSDDSNTERIG